MSIAIQPALPAAPAYGRSSIAEVLPSCAAALGVAGYENALNLPAARRICVVLVDGLGKALLKQRIAHAPYLRAALAESGSAQHSQTLTSAFPSTTVTSLASLGTGVAPGQHGMVGYDVVDPDQDKVVNLLGGWDPAIDPRTWQPFPTVFEQLSALIPTATVSLPKFAGSAMTEAALRGSEFLPASTPHARTEAAAKAMAAHESMLMYFYWSELDKAGHGSGSQSARWEHQFEELDAALRRLSRELPPDTLLLLTADHGMVDVPEQFRIDYSADPALLEGVRHTAGEPRLVQLHLDPDAGEAGQDRLVQAWQERHGNQAWVLTRRQAIEAGWFGPVRPEVLPRIGDVLIAAREPVAFYDTRRVPATALDVVGQHGSLTRAEREVPLLRLPMAGVPAGGRQRRG
ncbi:MAG: phosphodiesterase [Micrococcaceae bacterium]|nr:phosphodiesterase [Micrococcaceae bacterium]